MTTRNGTINGVSMLSGNPAGAVSTISSVAYALKSYLLSVDFPAYTASSDSATVTGILTAINAACRDGKTRVLVAVVPAAMGLDANGQGVTMAGASVYAETLTNTTTTGDATSGILTDAARTEITTSGTSAGCEFVAIVKESGTPT